MALNPRQKKFAEAYHLRGNATEAYCSVYKGTSEEAARRSASDLLTNPDIQNELDRLREEAREEFKVTRAEMLGLFHGIAFDPRHEPRDRISAGKEICRIEGHYSKQEVELSASDSFAEVLKAITGTKEK